MKTILAHAGLTGCCARNPALMPDEKKEDSISWIFDEKYRVCCRVAQNGNLVLEARVMELTGDWSQDSEILMEATLGAAYRIAEHSETLVLSEEEDVLLIQQWVAADATADVCEECLERFVNATANWRLALILL